MAIKAILFDLDGTLVPMDQNTFVKDYFTRLSVYFAPHGYESKQLIDSVWKGIAAMVSNDGTQTNKQAFWNAMVSVYGEQILADEKLFDDFYENEFDKVKSVCSYNPQAKKIVRDLKNSGYKVALATNPLFPERATRWRINWAELTPNDFELYTTYENISYCKPNLEYYLDVAKRLGVKPSECLMVGNDVSDDMVAKNTGMKVFLLTDCLINSKKEDISQYPNGSFDELLQYISSLSE